MIDGKTYTNNRYGILKIKNKTKKIPSITLRIHVCQYCKVCYSLCKNACLFNNVSSLST